MTTETIATCIAAGAARTAESEAVAAVRAAAAEATRTAGAANEAAAAAHAARTVAARTVADARAAAHAAHAAAAESVAALFATAQAAAAGAAESEAARTVAAAAESQTTAHIAAAANVAALFAAAQAAAAVAAERETARTVAAATANEAAAAVQAAARIAAGAHAAAVRAGVPAAADENEKLFIRFLDGESLAAATRSARADLRRGYSYHCYQFFGSRKAALGSDFVEYHGVDPDAVVKTGTGEWALRLPGLCGYEIDSTETESPDMSRYAYSEKCGFYAVFAGDFTGEVDCGDGDVFRPTRLLRVGSV